jgi:hypothetical protein
VAVQQWAPANVLQQLLMPPTLLPLIQQQQQQQEEDCLKAVALSPSSQAAASVDQRSSNKAADAAAGVAADMEERGAEWQRQNSADGADAVLLTQGGLPDVPELRMRWAAVLQAGVTGARPLPAVLVRAALHDAEVPVADVARVVTQWRHLYAAAAAVRKDTAAAAAAATTPHWTMAGDGAGRVHGVANPGAAADMPLSTTAAAQEQAQQQQLLAQLLLQPQQQRLLLRIVPGGHDAFERDVREAALAIAFLMRIADEMKQQQQQYPCAQQQQQQQ